MANQPGVTLKEIGETLGINPGMICRWRDAFPVRMMCLCLSVSPSGYYDWRSRPLSNREKGNQRLLDLIRDLHAESDGVKGAPRIWEDLQYEGEHCSMSGVGSFADNVVMEGFFGLLKRERVNRKIYQTRSEARTDVFDYTARSHNPRHRRKLDGLKQKKLLLTQPSVETG
ncbi:MAG: IS3 family transposase [Candidatus Thiodiazotropha sp. (ex Codakia rugifera)]|nr:IS3 family transposase [Candidatus Thiodiazotropha sp. (ex Codakia rugifera)]